MMYEQTEKYIFDSSKDIEQIKAFENAYPDWVKTEDTVKTVFAKTHIVTLKKKEKE